MGNWIGGDRDGNPNVIADTLLTAVRSHSETVLRFYLTEVHELGAELSISALLSPVTPEMDALAPYLHQRRGGRAAQYRITP
jgi:phosphoenolpyruvate carboxylase